MKIIAITRKEAERIARKIGISLSEDDGRTYYATDTEETEVWEFDSRSKREKACG